MEYQSCLNPLKEIKLMGLNVTWKLICMGLYGTEDVQIQVSIDEVCSYLEEELEENNYLEDKIRLICNKDDDWEFEKILREYEEEEGANADFEKRKWDAYILKRIIDSPNPDELQGLLELIEFWLQKGINDDCPQVFPSKKPSSLFPVEQYFTEEMYAFLIQKNRDWLMKEIQGIIDSEIMQS